MEILNFKGPLSDLIYILKKGGSIHIKKKNRGKFTESAKRAGMGVQEYARHVLANKDKYSSTLVKRANFARNAKKFKHEDGGVLFAQSGVGNWWIPQPLSPVGIALNQAKTRAKRNSTSEPLPPGVKEVVGPDGQKIAIRTEQSLVPLEQSIVEWLPGTGDVAEVSYIANDAKNGNLGSATLGAGLLLLPGNVGKILRSKRIANKLNSFIKKTSPEKISRYNEVQFIDQMFTDPNRAVHVSPNSVYGATKTKKAAHSVGNKWIPGTADVSKVGEGNLVWLWKGSPYRHQWNDQTFISIPIQNNMIQTRQKGAIAVPEIDLTSNEAVILTKNPIVGNFEKHIFIK